MRRGEARAAGSRLRGCARPQPTGRADRCEISCSSEPGWGILASAARCRSLTEMCWPARWTRAPPATSFFDMLRIVFGMLAVISLMLAPVAASAHELRMASGPGQEHVLARHVGADSHRAGSECRHGKSCGAEAPLCDFVCSGVSAFPPPGRGATGVFFASRSHGVSPGPAVAGRAPDLNERPPKTRLL